MAAVSAYTNHIGALRNVHLLSIGKRNGRNLVEFFDAVKRLAILNVPIDLVRSNTWNPLDPSLQDAVAMFGLEIFGWNTIIVKKADRSLVSSGTKISSS